MDFLDVRLHASARSLPDLAELYTSRLGLELQEHVALEIGATRLEFVAGVGEPFYHFAVLVPGNRFEAAFDWIGGHVELLPERESGELVFDFSNWDALACYFHDPAGNIVELIAHRGVGETDRNGSFAADELLGLSELGLVGDMVAMARLLEERVGLELWDGTLEGEGRLAFVGEKAKTLILCPEGRPWLPTGRPAEAHPVELVVSGAPEGEAVLESSGYRVRREAAE